MHHLCIRLTETKCCPAWYLELYVIVPGEYTPEVIVPETVLAVDPSVVSIFEPDMLKDEPVRLGRPSKNQQSVEH